jgi:tRNA(Ile2) C34 agmatinyltransferase TiaS
MGWFSNPSCPRCGAETVVDTDGLFDFYRCIPCTRANSAKKEQDALLKRIKELEEKVNQ